MKYSIVLSAFLLLTCGCGRIETITRLQTDQKLLKDSANHINDRIGQYLQKHIYDSAEAQKKQLQTVQARLAEIQSSIDKFNMK